MDLNYLLKLSSAGYFVTDTIVGLLEIVFDSPSFPQALLLGYLVRIQALTALVKAGVLCSWARDLTLTINSFLALFSYKKDGAACPKFCAKILLCGRGDKSVETLN